MSRKPEPIGIDLFSGVGGMSLGFKQAGFRIVAAIDSEPKHVKTYAENFPGTKALEGNLSKMSGQDIRKRAGLRDKQIDVVFGGPPCQGFSLIGKRQEDDPRNLCLQDFGRLISELRPLYFVMENVGGLLAGKAAKVLDSFVERVEKAGYKVLKPVQALDASAFGVPQRRRRVFVIGYQAEVRPPKYPKPITDDESRPSVWDAIGDLPTADELEHCSATGIYTGKLHKPSLYAEALRKSLDSEDQSTHSKDGKGLTGCLSTVHTPETRKKFAGTEMGKSEPVSRFHRLHKDGISCTLRAGTGPDKGSFMAARPIHPIEPRCITVREAARLHSYPDWFTFHKTKWHAFRQIGNSVPPLLAKSVARMIISSLSNIESGEAL